MLSGEGCLGRVCGVAKWLGLVGAEWWGVFGKNRCCSAGALVGWCFSGAGCVGRVGGVVN